MTDNDHAAVVEIVESLPEWFDETARRRSIPVDVKHQQGFIAVEDEVVVGFITLYVCEGRLNIGWIGVRQEFQRKGIGKALLCRAEGLARELAIGEIATHTVGDGVDYAPYEQTRRFYFGNGFEVYQRSQTDNPSCPEEIRLAKKVTQPDAPAGADKPRR